MADWRLLLDGFWVGLGLLWQLVAWTLLLIAPPCAAWWGYRARRRRNPEAAKGTGTIIDVALVWLLFLCFVMVQDLVRALFFVAGAGAGAWWAMSRRRARPTAAGLTFLLSMLWLGVVVAFVHSQGTSGFGAGLGAIFGRMLWLLLWWGLVLALPVFVWQVARGFGLARRMGARAGRAKAAAAALVGLLVFGGGIVALGAVPGPDARLHDLGPRGFGFTSESGFVPDARAALYNGAANPNSVDSRLQTATGERAVTGTSNGYQDQLSIVKAKETQMSILAPKIVLNRQYLKENETAALAHTDPAVAAALLAAESRVAALRDELVANQTLAQSAADALVALDGERQENLTALSATNASLGSQASALDAKVASLYDRIGSDQVAIANSQATLAGLEASLAANETGNATLTTRINVLRLTDAMGQANATLAQQEAKLASDQQAVGVAASRLSAVLAAAGLDMGPLEDQARTTRLARNEASLHAAQLVGVLAPQSDAVNASWSGVLATITNKTLVKSVNDLRSAAVDAPATLRGALHDRAAALEAVNGNKWKGMFPLAANHALYLQVSQLVALQEDGPAKALIHDAATDDRATNPNDLYAPFTNMESNALAAFAVKDQSLSDMANFLLWFIYPSLVGLLFAPLVWAQGSIVRAAWKPSDTVGFKPYPHFAAFSVLALGAFGVPAFWFAMASLRDIAGRAREGQISL
ncbi:MAG: hypothetical protein ACYDBQ_01840 [Thermoplasmatota archaeon]